MMRATAKWLLSAFFPMSGPWIMLPPWRSDMTAPFTPHTPRAMTTTQTSWLTRSRVVVSAYPIRHVNNIFKVSIHLLHTIELGANAKYDVIVIQNIKSKVNTTSGDRGSCFLSVRENAQQTQVRMAMIYA